MQYVKVENGQVTQTVLPEVGVLKDGRTVSGYNLLDTDTLQAEGWLPLEDDKSDFDDKKQELQFDKYEVQTDRVIAHYNPIDIPQPSLADVQNAKLIEISTACQNAIYAGVDATDSKGTEHFSLTLPDQTNLSALADAIAQGAVSAPYHAAGQLCRIFSAGEIKAVVATAKAFITKNVTLCNHLNVWVRRCTTADEVNAVTYTSVLPDDLQANYNAILAAAGITTAVNTTAGAAT